MLSDLRLAARFLKQSPGFTFIVILTLALCIGANSAIFSLVNSVLLRPLAYDGADRLALIWESAPFFGLEDSPVAPANYFDWEARSKSFESMGALEDASYRLTGDGEPEVVQGAVVTASLWRTLRTRPVLGRVFSEQEDQPGAARVAVVSDSFWRRRLGADPRAAGKTLRLNEERYTITGVLARGDEPPSEYTSKLGEIWTPLRAAYTPEQLANRGRHNWMVIARLRDGVTLAAADGEMKAIGQSLAREYPETNAKVGAFAAPLRDHFVRPGRETMIVLLGTVAVLLLIGCSNIANLFLSRSAARAKEVAVRAALGAGGWRILRRFLWESLLLCSLGSAAGLLLAPLAFEFRAHLAPGDLAGLKSLAVDWRVAGFTFGIAALTTAAFSVLPALQLRRLDVSRALKQSARNAASASGSRRLGAALVCAEVSLAFVLLTGAGLLIRAFAKVRGVDPGFETKNILTLRMPMSLGNRDMKLIAAHQNELRRRIMEIPGVISAGFTNNIPLLQKGNISGAGIEGRDLSQRIQCRARTAGPGYFATLGIPILHGRALDERDSEAAPKTVVINQALASLAWPGQSPLGRSLVFSKEAKATVVGVVADIHQSGLEVAPQPEYYISSLQAGFPSGAIAIRTRVDPLTIAGAVRRAVRSLDPDQPITELAAMEEILDREVFRRRIQTTLLASFAGLALLLASLGLYGVVSHLVGQRTAEIGIRMAVGATPRDLLHGVVGGSLLLTAAGLAAGLALSLASVKVLSSFLFGVTPTDLATYAAAAGTLLAAAALASYLPARRAMGIEPMQALREE